MEATNKKNKIKVELLKTWGDGAKGFEMYKNHAVRAVIDVKEFFISSKAGEMFATLAEWEVVDKFGMAYTDTSDCAALWCCGQEIIARYGELLTLHGVAIDTKYNVVFIFTKQNGDTVEFLQWDFYNYQKHEQKKHQAKTYTGFIKRINQAQKIILEILTPYAGKPYGEKTREKIYSEFARVAALGIRVYYDNRYSCFDFSGLGYSRNVYCKILNDDNKIILENLQQLKPLEEFDGVEEFEKVQSLAREIKTKAAELLPLVESYNEHARKISQNNRDCESVYSVRLASVADWVLWGQE